MRQQARFFPKIPKLKTTVVTDDQFREMLGVGKNIKKRHAKQTRHMNASDRENMIRLKVMMELSHGFRQDMDRRAELVPGLKRDLHLLANLTERVMDGFLATMDADQKPMLVRNVMDGSYATGCKSVNKDRRDDEFGMWLSFNQLNTILEALNNYCVLCPFDSFQQQKGCPLKKVLDELGADVEHDGQCNYQLL